MAGSKVNAFETDLLELIFNNTALANIGDASGLQPSGTAGSFYVALFTGDPTDTGSVANEATFGAYAREAVARTSGGWTVSGNEVSNTAAITFTEATSGSETISYMGIAKADVESTSDLIFHADLTTSRAVSTGVTLEFAIGAITITED